MPRIYNPGLTASASPYPDRHIGLACLPYGDIEAAVAEVHRVAKLGFKGIELSCSWEMEPMWHPQWEPLWQAINEVGIPLHFHTRSEEHTSELQSRLHLVCRLLLEKKKKK